MESRFCLWYGLFIMDVKTEKHDNKRSKTINLRRVGKALVWIGTGVSVAAILLVVAAAIWINTGNARSYILETVNQAIPGTIAVSDHLLNLPDQCIDLAGVEILSPSGQRVASADRLRIRLSLWDLMMNRTIMGDLFLDRPDILLFTDSNGQNSLAAPFVAPVSEKLVPDVPEPETRPFRWIIQSCQIKNGRLDMDAGKPGQGFLLDGIDISGDADFDTRYGHIDLSAEQGMATGPASPIQLGPLQLQADLQNGRLSGIDLNVCAEQTELSATGAIADLWDHPVSDLNVIITHQLDDLLAVVSLTSRFSGPVLLTAAISGDMMNPAVDLVMTAEKAMISGMKVDAIQLDARLEDRVLSIQKLTGGGSPGFVELTGRIDARDALPDELSNDFQMDRINYQALLLVKQVVLDRLFPGRDSIQGMIDGEIRVNGKGVSRQSLQSEASARLTGRQVRVVPDVQPSDIDLAFQGNVRPDDISLTSLQARTNGVDLQAEGRINLSPVNFQGNVDLTATNLAQALKPFGLTDIAGNLRIKANVDGVTGAPKGYLEAWGKGLSGFGVKIGDMNLAANLNADGIIDLKELAVRSSQSAILAKGRIGLFKPDGAIQSDPVIDLNIHANRLDIVNYLPDAGISGQVGADIRLSGNLKNPAGRMGLQGQNLMVNRVALGNLDVQTRFSTGTLFLDAVELTQHKNRLTGSGQIRFQDALSGQMLAEPVLDVSVRGNDITLSDFLPDIEALISIHADVKGPLSSPDGQVVVRARDIRTPFQDLARLDVTAALAAGDIQIQALNARFSEPAEASSQSGLLTVSGRIGRDKQISLEMTGTDISCANLGKVTHPALNDILLRLNARADGNMSNPDVTARMILAPARPESILPDAVSIDIGLKNHVLTSETRGMVTASARQDLSTGDMNLDMSLNNATLAPVFRMAGLTGFDGVIGGRLSVRGNVNQIVNSQVDVALSRLRVTQGEIRLIETDRLNMTAENGRFVLQDIQLACLKQGSLKIRGGGEITGNLDVSIGIDMPLKSEWKPPEFISDMGGVITGDFRMTGPTTRPDITGTVRIQDGELVLTTTGQRIHGVNAVVAAVPERIRIESLQGKLDDGTFELGGFVDLKQFQPTRYDIRLSGSALPVSVPDTLDGGINLDLTWTGPASQSRIAGRVTVLDTVYYREVEINPLKTLTETRRSIEIQKPVEGTGMTHQIGLDVRIERRGQLRIDNNLAQCDIVPELHVTGTLAKPMVTGRAAIETGTVFYYKKQFEIKKGIVDFTNPYRIDPVLDIEAESQIRQWLVKIALSGPLDALVLKLTSTPELESGELLSLIVLGKTSAEMIRAEGGNALSTQQILAGLVDSVLADDIHHYTGLDVLQAEPQRQDTGSTTKAGPYQNEILLSLGKTITPRLSIRYSIGTRKGESVQETVADYQLMEHLIVSGFQDSRGSVGGEIKYRYEFR